VCSKSLERGNQPVFVLVGWLVYATHTAGAAGPVIETMRCMTRRAGTVATLIFVLTAFGVTSSSSAVRTPTLTHTLHVDVTEWAVVPSQGLVSAGRLRLTVENYGRLRHELDIIPTDRWGQELEVRNGRAVGKNAARSVVVAPGQTRSAQVNLAPGYYVLLDNIRGHYAIGTAVSIIVA
jgi:uncharacterized cupredoxin-like copper-binding protein